MHMTRKLLKICRTLIGILIPGAFAATESNAATIALHPTWVNDVLTGIPQNLTAETVQVANMISHNGDEFALALTTMPSFTDPAIYAVTVGGLATVMFFRRCAAYVAKERRETFVNDALKKFIRETASENDA